MSPPRSSDVLALATVEQPLVAVMPKAHPLARASVVRLRDLAGETLVLPDQSLAGRRILDAAFARRGLAARPVVECNAFDLLWQILRAENAVSVQFALGAPALGGRAEAGLVSRPFDPREVPAATIVLGQLRERALPVDAARFAESLVASLSGLGAVSRT